MAAQPKPREMRKPDFPAVVHTYTDALRILRDQGPADVARLAEATSRDKSNIRRDLQRLRDAGVITVEGEAWTITDKGRQWVAGQDVAAGAAVPAEPAARWPIDQVRPNPANRRVDLDTIPDLALSIVAAGDILQPLILTPPDANGVRMILAGERRWRAASKLAAETTLQRLGIAGGLPFVEREATEAEALQITIIENSQRQDLSPWDDAQLLLQLQQVTDWNATELARAIGRAGEGERSGVRDVQTKLKVAREASPAAIAAYLENRSWDQLRNSVSQPKPQTLSEMLAESGPAVTAPPAPTPLEEAIDAADKGPMRAARFGVPEDYSCFDGGKFGNEADDAAAMWIEPGSMETFALEHKGKVGRGVDAFPRAQIQVARIKGSCGWIENSGYSLSNIGRHARLKGVHSANTTAFAARSEALTHAAKRIRDSISRNERNGVPADIETWLRALLGEPAAPTGPHVVNGVDYGNATRANEARYAAGILQRPRPNGGSPRRDEPPHEPVAPARTPEQDLPFRAPETGSPPTPTRTEDAGLNATLEVLLDRLEPVVAALKGERLGGIVHIDGHDADWMIRELEEASVWAEGAIADASNVFDPSGPEIARPSLTDPAVPIRKSITADHIVCLEDGRKFKSLKRHLRTRYNLSPEEYRAKWGLAADYPMVAPNYAKAREDLARQMGLR